MEKIFLQHFKRALLNELKGNKVAHRLYNLISSGKFNDNNKDNYPLLATSTPKEFNGNIPEETRKLQLDLRFQYLVLRNVKKFPSAPVTGLYGISFSRDSKPVHSVFLGSNGVGKTSLYTCLEYMGIGVMNTSIIRGYDGIIYDFEKKVETSKNTAYFFAHLDRLSNERKNPSETLFAKVFTNSEDIVLNGESCLHREPLVPDCFYCSDYDVRVLEQSETLSNYILYQLGLKDYATTLEFLYGFYDYMAGVLDKMSSLNILYEERLKRFVTGIAINRYSQKSLNPIKELQQIRELIDDDVSILKRTNILKSVLNKLIKEKKSIEHDDWFSQGVEEEYVGIIESLDSIKASLNEKTFSISMRSVYDKLYTFNTFRTLLSAEINAINNDFQDQLQPNSKLTQKIVELDYFKQYVNARTQETNISSGEHEVIKLFSDDIAYSELKREFVELVMFFENDLKNIINKWDEKIVSMTTSLLEEYFTVDNDKIRVLFEFNPFFNENGEKITKVSDSTNHCFLDFNIKILSCMGNLNLKDEDLQKISPRAYLNTFKYKLFCIALKLAFCCVAKDIYNINYPFIIDDVFDSSDFDNRVGIKDFSRELITHHNKIFLHDSSPLQIIFFTQDDLIADQFAKGIGDTDGHTDYKLSRIHDYHQMTGDDIETIRRSLNEDTEGEKYKYTRLEDTIR